LEEGGSQMRRIEKPKNGAQVSIPSIAVSVTAAKSAMVDGIERDVSARKF